MKSKNRNLKTWDKKNEQLQNELLKVTAIAKMIKLHEEELNDQL